jgi:hypothetical protein
MINGDLAEPFPNAAGSVTLLLASAWFFLITLGIFDRQRRA